ncbi:MAG: hypothetical protein EON60_10365 [Alphaproteobacteria bacterium]|nr:MAG: hypothetical protein EON60_10365 [Alphaproteobacteria bacterium]
MRAKFDEHAGLSPEQKAALTAYAETLHDRGWCIPEVDEAEVVEVKLQELNDPNNLLDVNGVRVHFSGGNMWQRAPMKAMTEPMDELPGSLYPVARLRGTKEAAVLDVVHLTMA